MIKRDSLSYMIIVRNYGQRNLLGYNPWDHRELDMTERPSIQPKMLSMWSWMKVGTTVCTDDPYWRFEEHTANPQLHLLKLSFAYNYVYIDVTSFTAKPLGKIFVTDWLTKCSISGIIELTMKKKRKHIMLDLKVCILQEIKLLSIKWLEKQTVVIIRELEITEMPWHRREYLICATAW